MQVVIATFESKDEAEAFMHALDDRLQLDPSAMSQATVAAYQQPHDGHRLVAAWVDDDRAPEARDLAVRTGGTTHRPSGRPRPDDAI